MATTSQIAETLKYLLAEAGNCLRLHEPLDIEDVDGEGLIEDCNADTFDECGILTSNDGIVLSLADGSEFQITVVRSK